MSGGPLTNLRIQWPPTAWKSDFFNCLFELYCEISFVPMTVPFEVMSRQVADSPEVEGECDRLGGVIALLLDVGQRKAAALGCPLRPGLAPLQVTQSTSEAGRFLQLALMHVVLG